MKRTVSISGKQRVWGIAIISLAVLIRTVYLIQSSRASPFFYDLSIDSLYHHLMALKISGGSFEISGPFFRAPLYPLFLGMLYSVIGESIFGAVLAGHLMGILIIIIIFMTGVRFFNLPTASAAALLYAFYWPALYFEGQLLVDTLFSLLVLLAVHLLLRTTEQTDSRHGIVFSGILLGLAAITRANILLFYPVAVLWLFLRRTNHKRIILFIAAAVVPILPVTAVNYFWGRDTVLIASQGGINFYIGNNEYADGMTANLPQFGVTWQYDDCLFYAERQSGDKNMKPSQVSYFYYGKAFDFFVKHPGKALPLFLKKLYLSINNYEVSNNQSLYFAKRFASIPGLMIIPFGLIAGLAAFAIAKFGFKDRRVMMMVFPLIPIWATMLLFFVTSRFRLPMMPYLSILGGYGIYGITKSFSPKISPGLILPTLVAVSVGWLSFTNFTGIDRDNYSQAYYNLGNIQLRNGDYYSARRQYRNAIESDPDVSLARLNLGNIFFYEGEYDSAEFYFREEIKYHPRESRTYQNIATLKMIEEDYDSSVHYASRALNLKPNLVPAVIDLVMARLALGDTAAALNEAVFYNRLVNNDPRLLQITGDIYRQTGRIDSAMFYYNLAMSIPAPGLASDYNLGDIYDRNLPFSSNTAVARLRAKYNTAVLLIQTGEIDRALELLLGIIQKNPGFVQALINAGLIYDLKGDYDKAIGLLESAYELDPDNAALNYNLGLVYAKTNRLAQAEAFFRRALEIDSSLTDARNKLELIRRLKNR